MKKNVLIILGMHRSGTSCLAGIIEESGIHLGEVVKIAPYNKKGNRENLAIRNLNDELLTFNNASWNFPPNEIHWENSHILKRDNLIKEFEEKPMWGFKDPRTIFTLPFWLDGLKNSTVNFVASFRHPLLVAKSLQFRQPELTIERGLALWYQYNKRLLELQDRYKFPVINFDLAEHEYIDSLKKIIAKLNFISESATIKFNFYDKSLLNNKLAIQEIKQFDFSLRSLMPIYDQLCALNLKSL